MSDPVTNALTLQMEYGDEQLRAVIEERIRQIVREELDNRVYSTNFLGRLVNDNAYDFETHVARAIKSYFNNPRQVY